LTDKANGDDRADSVPSELYTRDYFTTDCEGFDRFLEGSGELPERIKEALERAGDLEGKRVLDLGCGRGELVCELARRGAYAVGIDYAEAALELAEELASTLDEQARERVKFFRSDAKVLPFDDDSFDVVLMVDVYEHLHPYEIVATLGEIKRILRPGGLLVIHTGPNTWFYKYGYPLVRFLGRKVLRREMRETYRHESDKILHVNEQSPLSLFQGLKEAGFKPKILPRSFSAGPPPSAPKRAVKSLLYVRPFGYFFCQSLLAVARVGGDLSESRLRADRVSEMLGTRKGDKVLLLGEREGILADRLTREGGVEVTWLQPGNPTDNEPSRQAPVTPGYKRTTGDYYHLPYPDGHFDRIASQHTVEFLEDPEGGLAEWTRVLKTGGVMVLATRNRLFRSADQNAQPKVRRTYDPNELGQLVEKMGLELLRTCTLIPDLKLPTFYRGDLSFSLLFEKLPFFHRRGKVLFASGVKYAGGAGS
jgi:ubiquinone/menaquinone biosynthesis C-methylase UbiE